MCVSVCESYLTTVQYYINNIFIILTYNIILTYTIILTSTVHTYGNSILTSILQYFISLSIQYDLKKKNWKKEKKENNQPEKN